MSYINKLEEHLWKLQKSCNRYKNIDPLAEWVVFALERYIMTNRSNKQFEDNFLNYPESRFEILIKKCLNGDRSDNGIIKTCKKEFMIL